MRPRMSESPTSSSHPKRCRRLSKSSLDNLRSGAEAQMCSPQWLLGHKTEQDCALTHARSSVPVRVCLGQSRRRRSGPDCIMCRRGRRPHGHTVVPRGAAVRTACATRAFVFRSKFGIWQPCADSVCGCSVAQRVSAFTLPVILPSRQDAQPPVPWRNTVGGARTPTT